MSELSDRLQEVAKKVRLAAARRLTCFGATKHKFKFNPPITEDELNAFEQEHKITLPADYRAFLTALGNGGAGPYYGIYPLNRCFEIIEYATDDPPEALLSRPCPLAPDMDRGENWQDQLKGCPYQGCISIGTQGCAYEMVLIVTGPHSGRVVYVNGDGAPPYFVWDSDFLTWYERWLDELLNGYNTAWFGFGPGGTECDLARIMESEQFSDNQKHEAMLAFAKLPTLSDEGKERILAYSASNCASLRAGACSVIKAHKIEQALPRVEEMLEDSESAVRQQAVQTLMLIDSEKYADRLMPLLWSESDEDVVSSIFFKLRDAGKLHKYDLLRILKESPIGNLRALAAHASEWYLDDLSFLVMLLEDPNSQVRFYATLGLRKLRVQKTIAPLISLLEKETAEHVITSILKGLGEFGDQRAAAALRQWLRSEDDFYRLDALEALCKIGDEHIIPDATNMLKEDRAPVRRDAAGLGSMSHTKTIGQLTREMLDASPNYKLRNLK